MLLDFVASLENVRALLPDGYDLTLEDDFIQAGQTLVEIGRQAFIALGELVAWKVAQERALTEEAQTVIIGRYASAWGVSKSNLLKAFVTATRWPEIPRAEDAPPTAVYEVLSGSDTPEEAEAGMALLCTEGLHVQALREAKMLKRSRLVAGWAPPPKLSYSGGTVFARDRTGREVWVLRANGEDDDLVRQALAVLRLRAGL